MKNPLIYLHKPEILRISRNSNKEIDIASVLNNINVNDIENLHLLIESNDTDTINVKPDEKTPERITEKPSTKSIQKPKEEGKNCFIFDEETFELINLCPTAINSTKSILELNTTNVVRTVVLITTEASSNFTDV